MDVTQLPILFQQIEQQLDLIPNEVRRLFHGRGRQWPGLEQITVDWLEGQLIVSLFKEVDDPYLEALRLGLLGLTQQPVWSFKMGRSILLQHRYQDGAPSEVLFGILDDHPVVSENGLKYQLDIGRNQNFGLFLDMRLGRDWVAKQAKHANVLNLFAYTCGFSIAAIAGGADRVVNVDMARGSLAKGKQNHLLNGHNLNQVQFLGHDIFKSWGKISKFGPYNLIVIDPPSFQKGSFALTKDYQRILRRLPDLLSPGGQVLACVNSPAVGCDFLIETMRSEAPTLEFKYRLDNPVEFDDVDVQASLKVLVFA
jgi:23S rRNA (cytosine1962-C5)-methyltransferase